LTLRYEVVGRSSLAKTKIEDFKNKIWTLLLLLGGAALQRCDQRFAS
jgi:hypothetical protein